MLDHGMKSLLCGSLAYVPCCATPSTVSWTYATAPLPTCSSPYDKPSISPTLQQGTLVYTTTQCQDCISWRSCTCVDRHARLQDSLHRHPLRQAVLHKHTHTHTATTIEAEAHGQTQAPGSCAFPVRRSTCRTRRVSRWASHKGGRMYLQRRCATSRAEPAAWCLLGNVPCTLWCQCSIIYTYVLAPAGLQEALQGIQSSQLTRLRLTFGTTVGSCSTYLPTWVSNCMG